MIAVKCDGDLEEVADQLASIDEIDYVVITPARSTCCSRSSARTTTTCWKSSAGPGRLLGDQHRNLRVSEVAQADLFLGTR